jgi:hypothetical protein
MGETRVSLDRAAQTARAGPGRRTAVNVSGVGATPPPPPLPPVAPPAPATAAASSGGRPQSGTSSQHGARETDRPTAGADVPEAPPLRMITVTEMRVMLGQLPASAAMKLEHSRADPAAAS